MKDGDTVRHDSHGLVEVVKVYWNPLVEEDMAVIRAQNGLCYYVLQSELALQSELVEVESIRWQEAGF